MKLFPAFVWVLMCFQSVSVGGPPNKPAVIVPVQSQERRDPLNLYQGTWRVTGAAMQVGGLIEYRFSGNKLIITYHTPDREKDGTRIPPRVSERDYRVAVSERGNYLKLTPLPEQQVSKEIIYRVTYSDGNLRLYDYQPDRRSDRNNEIYTWQLRRVKQQK